MSDPRGAVGVAGERIAASWLADQGLTVVARNLQLDDGEIDLLAFDRGVEVAVEVRTITGSGDPLDAVDPGKRRRVSRLAALAGAKRVDFLGVGLRPWGIEVHWLPG